MTIDVTVPNRSQTIGAVIDSAQSNFSQAAAADAAHQADLTAHGLTPINAAITDYAGHKLDLTAHGLTAVKARITANEAELAAGRGSQATLDTRLSNALTPSGAVKLAGIASKWITPGDVPTFIDTTHFSVPTDRRLVFIAGAMLRLTVSGAYVYAPVASSAFGAGITTVTLDPAYPVLTSGLSALDLALIAFDNTIANSVATLNALMVTQASLIAALQIEEVETWSNGAPTASQVLLRYVCTRPFTVPINAAGSQLKGTVAATASATFSLQKNGAAIGTAVVSAAGTAAAFTVASATNFAAGDLLTLVAPAGPDATLANLAINIKGTLL